jgi:thioredoxin 1
MKRWKTSACVLLCTVAFTGCTQKNKEKASVHRQAGTVIHIASESEFDTVIAQGNVVVDFYASWCGPCKNMGPIIDELAKEMTQITFVKVDTEKFNMLSKRFSIRSLPTFIFFKDGQKIQQVVGAHRKVELRNEIQKAF